MIKIVDMYYEHSVCDLFYRLEGEGIPLILLHGYSLDYTCLSLPMEKILNQYPIKRMYIDLPGMGRSQNHKHIDNADTLIAVLKELINDLFPQGSLAFAGYSYGGYLGRCLTDCFRDRCCGYHGNCPVVIPDKKSRTLPPQPLESIEETLPDSVTREEKELFYDSTQIRTKENWYKFAEVILPGLKGANRGFLKQFKKSGYASQNYDKAFQPSDYPHFLFLGEQDYITGTEDTLSYYRQLEQGRIVISQETGHLSYLEAETLYQKYLTLWLDEMLLFASNQ